MKPYEIFIQNALRLLASEFGISTENVSETQLWNDLDRACPEATKIFREMCFDKDKLDDYLNRYGATINASGDLIIDGNPAVESYYSGWLNLNAQLTSVKQKCLNNVQSSVLNS